MKKIYFATGNKQKLERMNHLAQSIADDFIVEKVPELIEVEENGATPVENALQKIAPYEPLDAPIIAGDTWVYFDDIAFDPTHVKRQALEKAGIYYDDVTQEEIYDAMIEFYKSLADSKWWEFPFYYLDGWAIKYPNENILTLETKRHNILTDTTHWEKQLYFPMCNLYKSQKTGKYYTDRTRDDNFEELSEQIELLQKIYNQL